MSSPTKKPVPPTRKDSIDEPLHNKDGKDFKDVARKAVKEHDELKRKYSQKEIQSRQLAAELEETKDMLHQLESASGVVMKEYQTVQCRLDIETQCRQEAEKYASKTVREIKELKRKSQMIFAQNGIDFTKIVDISLEEDEEAANTSVDGDLGVTPLPQELERQVQLLKDQLLQTNKDLSYAIEERDNAREDMNAAYFSVESLKGELNRERMAHEMTKKALEERDNVINQLKRVSALVYDEFNQVQLLYQKESAMREQAEQLASEFYTKNKEAEAYKRQSAILLNDAIGGDSKLVESLSEMEKLTKELEEEREKHKLELKQVQEELERSQDRERMETMENKLSIAREENESLERRVRELELKNKELDFTIKELDFKLKEAESKPSLPNIPPPPPPPPMPQLPKNPLEMLQKIIGRKPKAKVDDTDGRQLDDYQIQFEVAMKDMITRIKKGQVKLRPTQPAAAEKTKKPPPTMQKPGTTQAVQELDSILKNLKNRRTNRPMVLPPGTSHTAPDDQFAKIMQKRLVKSSQPTPQTTN